MATIAVATEWWKRGTENAVQVADLGDQRISVAYRTIAERLTICTTDVLAGSQLNIQKSKTTRLIFQSQQASCITHQTHERVRPAAAVTEGGGTSNF